MSDRLKQIKSKLFVDGEVFYHGDVQDLFHEIDDLTAEVERLQSDTISLHAGIRPMDAELERRDVLISRLKEDGERLVKIANYERPHSEAVTLHRQLMAEIEDEITWSAAVGEFRTGNEAKTVDKPQPAEPAKDYGPKEFTDE